MHVQILFFFIVLALGIYMYYSYTTTETFAVESDCDKSCREQPILIEDTPTYRYLSRQFYTPPEHDTIAFGKYVYDLPTTCKENTEECIRRIYYTPRNGQCNPYIDELQTN